MSGFERDPIHEYSASMRVVPSREEIDDARREIETYISSGTRRESSSFELDFAYNGLRVVAHAGSVISPFESELPDYLTVNYMVEGEEDVSSLIVHLPSAGHNSPILREAPIRDTQLSHALGSTAVNLLVHLVDHQVTVARHGYSEEDTSLEMGADMILTIVKNGMHALRLYRPYLEEIASVEAAQPSIHNLVTGLRSALILSDIPRKLVTHQSPQAGTMTAGGIIVTPSSERQVIVTPESSEVDDIYQVELYGTVDIPEGAELVPLKVSKNLFLHTAERPQITIDVTPPLPKFGAGSAELFRLIRGDNPLSQYIDHITRDAARGDLAYFLNMLALTKPPEGK